MNEMRWRVGTRRVLLPTAAVAVVVFALDPVAVIFFGGVNLDLGSVRLRSTTLEFPAIGLLCSLALALAVAGKMAELGLLLVSLGVSGACSELVLRALDHPLSRPYADYERWYEPSDGLGHKLAADFDGFGPLNVRVKTNSQGYRDDEHRDEKGQGRLRILGLGDSFTFGWGVKVEESYLKQLGVSA